MLVDLSPNEIANLKEARARARAAASPLRSLPEEDVSDDERDSEDGYSTGRSSAYDCEEEDGVTIVARTTPLGAPGIREYQRRISINREDQSIDCECLQSFDFTLVCKHALAVMTHPGIGIDPHPYIAEFYYTSTWRSMYTERIMPVTTDDLVVDYDLFPPPNKAGKGRRKSKRVQAGDGAPSAASQMFRPAPDTQAGRAAAEADNGRGKKAKKCGKCKQMAFHNRLTCTGAPPSSEGGGGWLRQMLP